MPDPPRDRVIDFGFDDPVLQLYHEAEIRVAAAWRVRVLEHLAAGIDRELRGGAAVPTAETGALTVIRQLAEQLEADGDALEAAAASLKSDPRPGTSWRASQTYQAAQRARAAARALLVND